MGGPKLVKVDIRVICAHESESRRVGQHKGLPRRSVLPFEHRADSRSPLRDRKEGIRLLVDAFLEKHGADAKCWDRTAKFMDEVMAYGWVGNIRELESVVQRIIALPDLTHLDFRHSGVDVASILGLPTV